MRDNDLSLTHNLLFSLGAKTYMAQLYFYYSAMNAGKSTALLQSAYNYEERGMRSEIFTAALDHRFGEGKVTSRIGLAKPAHLFAPESNLFEHIQQFNDDDAALGLGLNGD